MKLKAGRYLVDVGIEYKDGSIILSFPFNEILKNEVKVMEGARFDGASKNWTVKDCARNRFQLDYLAGKNPYAKYDAPISTELETNRPLFQVQKETINFILARHYCLLAEDMGLGKTLSFIEAAERSGATDIWYIGPKAGVRAVSRELRKWDAHINPLMMTYNGLVNCLKSYQGKAPQFVCFDESSNIKTPESQRSKVAMHLASSVRAEHGDKGYVVLMTGTPAPKNPTDYWFQCEVACPGYLREGNINKFRERLALMEKREGPFGAYPHLVTWLDNENKCGICGKFRDDPIHATHPFVPSKNEVRYLYERLKGLVIVKMAKDCLDLPDRVEEVITVRPTVDAVRAMNLIKASSRKAIQALTLMRELSDGFQYKEVQDGETACPACTDGTLSGLPCGLCKGTMQVPKMIRKAETLFTPKDEIFTELLEQYDEVGRFIVWGGFTATVDKLTDLAIKEGWAVLRVDGRGYNTFNTDASSDVLLGCMDYSDKNYEMLLNKYPKVCFVGNPGAGGMALTLTGATAMLYYSNTFNGTDRMQSEKRAERAGMRKDRGLTIYDIIYLPTDKLVMDNLKKKKDLQSISMGEIDDVIKEMEKETNGLT